MKDFVDAILIPFHITIWMKISYISVFPVYPWYDQDLIITFSYFPHTLHPTNQHFHSLSIFSNSCSLLLGRNQRTINNFFLPWKEGRSPLKI